MTEAEWLACGDSEQMIKQGLFDRGDCTKLVRFSLACAYHLLPWMTDLRSRQAVEIAERYMDGQATGAELRTAEDEAYEASELFHGGPADGARRPAAVAARWAAEVAASERSWGRELVALSALSNARCVLLAMEYFAQAPDALEKQRADVCSLLRCIFGNPFRPVAFSPDWRTDTAVSLARQMYESRDFGAMPILADALQDAGCDNDDILSHCRGAGPHVRGCWVVDLVLGKQ